MGYIYKFGSMQICRYSYSECKNACEAVPIHLCLILILNISLCTLRNFKIRYLNDRDVLFSAIDDKKGNTGHSVFFLFTVYEHDGHQSAEDAPVMNLCKIRQSINKENYRVVHR